MARVVGQPPYAAGPRRRPLRTALLIAFLVVPIAEIATIIAVGKVIGGWQTVLLLLLMSVLGTWLMRREGSKTWRALNTALSTGAMPSRELADAALVLIGGTLLLAPGFLTDVVGLFVILPVTRPITRVLLEKVVRARLVAAPAAFPFPPGTGPQSTGPQAGQSRPGHTGAGGETVEGRVVDR